jgi:hypothetical protein
MKKFIILCLTISYAIGSSSEIIKTYNLKTPSFINNMSESFTKNLSTKNILIGLGAYYTYFYLFPKIHTSLRALLNLNDNSKKIIQITNKLNSVNSLYNWDIATYPTANDIDTNSRQILQNMQVANRSGLAMQDYFKIKSQSDLKKIKDILIDLNNILPIFKERSLIGYVINSYTINQLFLDQAAINGIDIDDEDDYCKQISTADFATVLRAIIGYTNWNQEQQQIINLYLDAKMKEARLRSLIDLANRQQVAAQPANPAQQIGGRGGNIVIQNN